MIYNYCQKYCSVRVFEFNIFTNWCVIFTRQVKVLKEIGKIEKEFYQITYLLYFNYKVIVSQLRIVSSCF